MISRILLPRFSLSPAGIDQGASAGGVCKINKHHLSNREAAMFTNYEERVSSFAERAIDKPESTITLSADDEAKAARLPASDREPSTHPLEHPTSERE